MGSERALAALLAAAGVAHFVVPEPYEEIVPPSLGSPSFWVQVSGVAELACAAALLPEKTRRAAAGATALLFVLVFPANVFMALEATGRVATAAAWLRLPLQVPLIWWALRVRRSATTGSA